MIDNSAHPQLSCLISDGETMHTYIEQSKMQLLKLKSLLLSYYNLYVYMDHVERLTNGKNMQFIIVKQKQTSIIMNVHIFNHFETVKRM